MAVTMIVAEMGRSKNIAKDPCDMIRDWRTEDSASGPKTIASTAGAKG